MRHGRRIGLAAFVACLTLVVAAESAGAAVRHAAVGGAGPEPCAENAPCSLADAVGGASNGDEVVVAPGTYTVPGTGLDISTSIYVHGRPGEAVPVLTQAVQNPPTVRVATLGVALSDLVLQNTSAAGTGNTLQVLPGGVTLDRVAIRHGPPSTLAVQVFDGALLQLFNSSVHATGTNVVALSVSGNVDLVNTTVVATGTGSEALHLGGTAASPVNATVRNSILDGPAFDVFLQPGDPGAATLTIDHSNYDSLLRQMDAVVNEGAGNQTAAPLLTADLHQQQGSPTIDAGVTDPDGALDLDAEGRPGGSAPDIGADERYPNGPVRYTAPDGIGRGFCTAPAAACPITRAVEDLAVDNDEIVAMPGTYPLTATLDVDETVTLHGQEGAPRPLLTGTFAGVLVHATAGAGTQIANLELRPAAAGATALLSDGGAVVIDRVFATATGGNARAIALGAGDTLTDSIARSDGSMLNAAVYGQGAVGDASIAVRNTTAVATGGPTSIGVWLDGMGNDTMLLRNVIAMAPADLLVMGSGSTMDVAFSNFDTPGGPLGGTYVFGAGNQSQPPLLANAVNGDVHQLTGSPTIDAGFDTLANGTLDFEGDPRIVGARTDIGADEFRTMPSVATGAASAIGQDGATLGGSAHPQRLRTTVRFEYGTDTGYGSQTAAQDAGSGNADVPFSAAVGGLSPNTTYHYRAVATNSGGTSVGEDRTFTTAAPPPPTPPEDRTAPVVNAFAASNKTFRVGMPARAGRGAAPAGTVFRYRLTEDARVTITIARRAPGRRVGGRCVKPTRRNRARKRCSRFVRAGALSQAAQAGGNSRAFAGRFGRRKLRPSRYRATIVAVDRAGNRSAPRSLNLRVVRR